MRVSRARVAVLLGLGHHPGRSVRFLQIHPVCRISCENMYCSREDGETYYNSRCMPASHLIQVGSGVWSWVLTKGIRGWEGWSKLRPR